MQVEPPPHVAVLEEPVDCVHIDMPSQVLVQLLPHVPLQLVFDAQCEVQSVPQLTLHVFMCWQSNVTPDGALALPPSLLPPSPALAPPSVQVPPAEQVHVVSVQVQAPLHWPCKPLCDVQPPHSNKAMMIGRMPILRVTMTLDTLTCAARRSRRRARRTR